MIVQGYRIWSFEHNKWWAPYSMGYVSDIKMAGIYSLEEAIVLCKYANLCPMWNDEETHAPCEAMVPVNQDHDNE